MKILLSNDDGIYARGIITLCNELSKEHDVYVVAPGKERSAAGHSLTLHDVLRVEEIPPKYGAKRCWQTSGTPGDCVKLAITSILAEDEKPDVIITGINHGPNLGVDIIYSGTVSCALEGAMLGYPSIAVSLNQMDIDQNSFDYSAKFVRKFLPQLKKFNFPKKTVLNINIPGVPEEKIEGVAITCLGKRMFTDGYEKRLDPRGKVYYWMAGEQITDAKNDKSDINAVRWNEISITPITYEMTHKSIIPALENILCPNGVSDWLK